MSEPSPAEHSGRDAKGRFGVGNRLGVGNPHAKKIGQIRAALMNAVKAGDIRIAVKALVESAKGGDRFALAELLDRTIGRAIPMDIEDRLTRLEAMIAERNSADGASPNAPRFGGNGDD